MAGERKRIGLREVRALSPGDIVWDAAIAGFGVRRQKGPAITYFVKYRTADGRQRWQVIGRHGVLTPNEARDKAKAILGDVVDGADPAAEKMAARKAMTVAELCDLYLADAEAGRLLTRRRGAKKASTLLTDRGRIIRHIKPLLGRLAVAAVDRTDIERFMHAVAEGKTAGRIKTGRYGLARVNGGKGTATRTVGLLGAIFTYAVRQGVRTENPVHGVVRYADGRRERRLSDDEYAALGAALREAETQGKIWPAAIAMARFLALTGWRSGEAQALRWCELDLARRTATLSDTKTGRSIRPLSHAACYVLRRLQRLSADRAFPATRGDGPMVGFKKFWPKVAKLRELPADITPHVLRHSFASLAADLGYSEPTIATLVGHQGHSVTSRYMHVADAPLIAAADAVANKTAALMGDPRPEGIVTPNSVWDCGMTDPWLVGDLGNMMESPQITPAYLAYLFCVVTHRSRPSPPWGPGPAPGEVLECWERLNSWKSLNELTNTDLVSMLREAGAPECQPEQVEGLCGLIGGYISRRERAAGLPTIGREPSERIAAACAELRRAIPHELECLEGEVRHRPDASILKHEIIRLTILLKAAKIEDLLPRFPEQEADPKKYDPDAVKLIFFSYEMLFGKSGISRSGPAVRFIETAITRIGWHPISPGAIEQLLRRSLNK